MHADVITLPVRAAAGVSLPLDAPLPSRLWDAAPWAAEGGELGAEESFRPDELLLLPWQAVRDRPARAATASRESLWRRMVLLQQYGWRAAP
ncbi:hypothetical protein BFF78_34325 [Streptomyces fodineus]|uniref:Uncharacterized protein n=1 Tax=Streptomyces fodineus TaxID=1904616 RepID=A0A1D7YIV8_9ACTN|nr:hypothetical protein BFF78_34325 [Streptomyces fodineus]